MMKKPTATVFGRVSKSLTRFRDDERGAMAFFVIIMAMIMIIFGGIAVDVMRFETRRVVMQQTMDRAALAAASLSQTRDGKEIAEDWFAKSGLSEEDLAMVEFSTPEVSAINDAGLRRVNMSARVRSANFFMSIIMDVDYLDGPTTTEAAQGVSEIEVMLVLDITGSMNETAGLEDDPATTDVNEASMTKIQSLRSAAQNFVTLVKENDSKDGVSIGMVPYAAQVNLPADLRAQFSVTKLSSWDGVADAGVPYINCIEIPTSTYTATALYGTVGMPMAAVADTNSSTTTTTDYIAPGSGTPSVGSRICTTLNDNTATPMVDERTSNHVFLPTKDGEAVKTRIQNLQAAGTTSIAVGMRWGTALLDETARPIYTAIGDSTVQGRPADNNSIKTRKIIVLMTDGEHVSNNYIYDTYKTGLSPIWRGADGNFAIRFTTGGAALTNGTRPGASTSNTCSGWVLTNYANRQYFVPHLKRNSVQQKSGSNPEGAGTGSSVAGACDPLAWLASPSWSGSGTVTQLDWSEVWRYVRVSWMARQLYMRSGVSGATNYTTIMNTFRGTYLSVSNMNTLLSNNCTAAKNADIEVYGIAFAAPANGQLQISNCSSEPKTDYYFNAANGASLESAFRKIATDISELRLTQ